MESALSRQALREVCAAGGCLAESELARRLHCRDGSTRLARALADAPQFARVTREEAPGGGEQRVVVGATGARLCREHGGGQCGGRCGQLHLCRYFVCGGCRYQGSR